MFSLKLVLCVCMFFVIGMEGAPKPKPKAEPKPFPPIRYPPHSGSYQGANPGPWNWNGFPPTRGYYPWQRNWNRLQMNRKILDEYPASVTVSSSGAVGKEYPELMGRYLLMDELYSGHPQYIHPQNSDYKIYYSGANWVIRGWGIGAIKSEEKRRTPPQTNWKYRKWGEWTPDPSLRVSYHY